MADRMDAGMEPDNRAGKGRNVPVWQKYTLTLEEAAAYFGIGMNKLRKMTDGEDCTFVLWNGTRRLIKRQALEKYLAQAYSI